MRKKSLSLYNLGLKYECFSHYCHDGTPHCAQCGLCNLHLLELDHVNNDGKLDRLKHSAGKGGSQYYLSLRRRGYPKDIQLQVLCTLCHKKKPRPKPQRSASKRTRTRILTEFEGSNLTTARNIEIQIQSLWDTDEEAS